jgi:hypothetical protein
MYELPTLTPVGRAEEVIRGILTPGGDLDGTIIVGNFEFESDWDE